MTRRSITLPWDPCCDERCPPDLRAEWALVVVRWASLRFPAGMDLAAEGLPEEVFLRLLQAKLLSGNHRCCCPVAPDKRVGSAVRSARRRGASIVPVRNDGWSFTRRCQIDRGGVTESHGGVTESHGGVTESHGGVTESHGGVTESHAEGGYKRGPLFPPSPSPFFPPHTPPNNPLPPSPLDPPRKRAHTPPRAPTPARPDPREPSPEPAAEPPEPTPPPLPAPLAQEELFPQHREQPEHPAIPSTLAQDARSEAGGGGGSGSAPIVAPTGAGSVGRRHVSRPRDERVIRVAEEIKARTGIHYPPSLFDPLRARFAEGWTVDDALAVVAYAETQEFWREKIGLSPAPLFRKEKGAELLAKARARAGLTGNGKRNGDADYARAAATPRQDAGEDVPW